MDINVICIGKLKERYWTDAIAEYSKRLKPYCALTITELKESRLKANAGPAEEEEVKVNEGRDILSHIGQQDFVITLEIKGKKLTSEKLAGRADYKLSFSDMTFPHQMMRVILLEQIYRSYKIQRGEPYHK